MKAGAAGHWPARKQQDRKTVWEGRVGVVIYWLSTTIKMLQHCSSNTLASVWLRSVKDKEVRQMQPRFRVFGLNFSAILRYCHSFLRGDCSSRGKVEVWWYDFSASLVSYLYRPVTSGNQTPVCFWSFNLQLNVGGFSDCWLLESVNVIRQDTSPSWWHH